MLVNKTTRKKRLDSPEFRTILGRNLRLERIKQGYSLADISQMTTIIVATIRAIEKGEATNIDYYIEYAKAVKYDFGPISTMGIELKPKRQLPPRDKKATNLTAKIRAHIIMTEFLTEGKTVGQIQDELGRLGMINPPQVSATEIAGVMRNLHEKNVVKVIGKDGRKNVYGKI